MTANQFATASLIGRGVLLRPVRREDLGTFFQWRVDLKDLQLWAPSRRVPSEQEFESELANLLAQSITLVVHTPGDTAPVGFVQAYNMNLIEGWGFSLAYASPQHASCRVEAYLGLLHYLFDSFPLRKIYADVVEFNLDWMKPLLDGGFVQEGLFRQHFWSRDQFWNVHRLAMYRRDWDRYQRRESFQFCSPLAGDL